MEGIGRWTVGMYQRCQQGPRRNICCDRGAAERAVTRVPPATSDHYSQYAMCLEPDENWFYLNWT